MNFQQLRYVREAVRRDLNLTEAANALSTSQSGVSKQIRELEVELGIEIFIRKGKRIIGLTNAGKKAAAAIERVLLQAENIRRLAADYRSEERGRLIIATTHNHARHTLPDVLVQFAERFPEVDLEIRQETPRHAAEAVLREEADIAIATEALDEYPALASYPCFSWRHVAIAPTGHPLADFATPSLTDIAPYPVITYNADFSGRGQIDAAFAAESIAPDIRLTAMDAAVIQAYVARGMGIGIVSEMAVRGGCDDGLVEIPGSRNLFEPSIAKVALLRGALLRSYTYDFIEFFAPHLSGAGLRESAFEAAGRRLPRPTNGQAVSIPTLGEMMHAVSKDAAQKRQLDAGAKQKAPADL